MIKKYEFGKIIIDGKKYEKDVFIGLKGITSWWRLESHNVVIKDLEGVEDEQPEVVIIGNGADSVMKVSSEVKEFFAMRKIPLVIKDSKSAADEYNKMKKEGKRVVALFHLTC